MLKSLPVLMYHYISSWPNSIAVDPEVFESHLTAMTEAGYRGISLDSAVAYLRDGKPLPKKSVLITFDDGFLDNYVTAWPLLRQHGHKGTIFAVTNKIGHDEHPRPTLSDVWDGYINYEQLPPVNKPFRTNQEGLRIRTDMFFSWKEARAMEADGTMSIAGHTHFHRSVFKSSSFSSLYAPGVRKRTFDRIDEKVIYGLPRFEDGPSMQHRAFRPSDALYEFIENEVPQDKHEAHEYFRDEKRKRKLLEQLKTLPESQLGRYESQNEFEERVYEELRTSHRVLEQELGRPANVLAWPWGASCEASVRIAEEIGFSVLFTTKVGPNPPSVTANHAHRFKVRNKSAAWLKSRLRMYSNTWVAKAYGMIHNK